MKKRVTYKSKTVYLPDANNLPKPCYADISHRPSPGPGPSPEPEMRRISVFCLVSGVTITINDIERSTALLLQGSSYVYRVTREGYHPIVGQGVLQENASFLIEEGQFIPLVIDNTYSMPFPHPFSEGTLSGVSIASNKLQLTDGYLTPVNYSWTAVQPLPTNQRITLEPSSILVVGPRMMPEGREAVFYSPATQAYGTWDADISFPYDDQWELHYNYFIASTNSLSTMNGYGVSVEYSYDYIFIDLYRIDNGQSVFLNEWYTQTDRHLYEGRYRVIRDLNGGFDMWFKNVTHNRDWVHMIGGPNPVPYVDNTYTTTNYQFFRMIQFGGNNVYNYQISPYPATGAGDISPTGTYISPVVYGGANFKNWSNIQFSQELVTGSQAMCYIRYKNLNEAEWSAWTEVLNNQILSSTKNCAQIKWEAHSNEAQTQSPAFDSFTLTWEEYTAG